MELRKSFETLGLGRVGNLFCLSVLFMSTMTVVAVEDRLACLERDWFTLFARENFDVTSFDIAVADPATSLSRILVAVSDWDGKNVRNSQLTYLDYRTCETVFVIRQSDAVQPGLSAMAIHSQLPGQPETIYHVAKVYGQSRVVVTKVQDIRVETWSFSTPFFADIDMEHSSKGALLIVKPNLLLWQHAHGSMVLNLNLYIARSLFLKQTSPSLTCISAVGYQDRYLNTFSYSRKSSVVLWLHSYDYSSLYAAASSAKLDPLKVRRFELPGVLRDVLVSDTSEAAVALCFVDWSGALNLAYWRPENSETLFHATMQGDQDFFQGCASVRIGLGEASRPLLTALIYTSNERLATLTFTIDTMVALKPGQTTETQTAYSMSQQRLQMFSRLTGLQYSIVPGFIAARGPLFGGPIQEWGFILSTDEFQMRKTELWGTDRKFQNIEVAHVPGTDSNFTAYTFQVVESSSGLVARTNVHASAESFVYNDWVFELCPEPQSVTLFGANFFVNYPKTEKITIRFEQLIDPGLSFANPWFDTCFPALDVVLPSKEADRIKVLSLQMAGPSAVVEISKIAQADLYVQRGALLGLNTRHYQQVAFYLNLPDNVDHKYVVGRKNQPPMILDPVPFNDNILISIRWADQPLANKTAFLEDTNGTNRDLLWVSGPIRDPDGDNFAFKQVNLTYIFTCEINAQNRVQIRMARPMRKEYAGIHKFSFRLSDDGLPGPAVRTYNVTIVLALQETIRKGQSPKSEKGGENELEFKEFDQVQIVPPAPNVDSTEAWFFRAPYDERKPQIRVHALSSEGRVSVSFTKPVEWPDDIRTQIVEKKLINATFSARTYDVESIDGAENTTQLKSWRIEKLSQYSIELKFFLANPDIVGYSIYESDQIRLDMDFRSVLPQDYGAQMFGQYVKVVPLQYPQAMAVEDVQNLEDALQQIPCVMLMLLVVCFALLSLADSVDQTAVVWLTLSNLQLVAFLPLMNVPVPAQVNQISKSLSAFLRLDFISWRDQSLMTLISEYIFDFPAPTEVPQVHFEQLGFESRNSFSTAFGLSLFHLIIAGPVILLLIGLSLGRVRFKTCGLMFSKLRQKFYHTFYIRYNFETYLVYLICNMLTTQHFSFYNWATSLQSLTSSLHLLVLAILPIAIVVFYSMNYERLLTRSFRATYGAVYTGLIGEYEATKTRVAVYYPAVCLARKFVFALAIVVLKDNWIVQLGCVSVATSIVIYITAQQFVAGPYQNKNLNRLQIFLDCLLLLLTDFMVAFNGGGLISEPAIRFNIGWAYTSVLAVSLAVPYVAMVVMTLRIVESSLKRHSAKKSKVQINRDRAKTRALRRQSARMELLKAHSFHRIGNVVPIASQESGESSLVSSGSALASPGDNRIVLQQSEDRVAIKVDNVGFNRGLTEIQEGLSDEEDDSFKSSSFSESFVSNITESVKSILEGSQSNEFVMGLDLLPVLSRQGLIKGRPRTVPPRGQRAQSDLLPTSSIRPKRDSSDPPRLSFRRSSPTRERKKTLIEDEEDDDDDISSEARDSSKEGQSTNNERKGNRTTKTQAAATSSSNQFKIAQSEDQQTLRESAAAQTDRGLLLSQKESKRASRRSGRLQQHQMAQLSRRSSESVLSQLDKAVTRKLSQLVEMKVERREQSQTPEREGKTSPTKGKYVMGKLMARESMILDMTDNIILLSNLHDSVSQSSKKSKQHFSKQSLRQDQDVEKRQHRASMMNRPSQGLVSHSKRLRKQAHSMSESPDLSLSEEVQTLNRGVGPKMEQVSERPDEFEEASVYRSKKSQLLESLRESQDSKTQNNLVSQGSFGNNRKRAVQSIEQSEESAESFDQAQKIDGQGAMAQAVKTEEDKVVSGKDIAVKSELKALQGGVAGAWTKIALTSKQAVVRLPSDQRHHEISLEQHRTQSVARRSQAETRDIENQVVEQVQQDGGLGSLSARKSPKEVSEPPTIQNFFKSLEEYVPRNVDATGINDFAEAQVHKNGPRLSTKHLATQKHDKDSVEALILRENQRFAKQQIAKLARIVEGEKQKSKVEHTHVPDFNLSFTNSISPRSKNFRGDPRSDAPNEKVYVKRLSVPSLNLEARKLIAGFQQRPKRSSLQMTMSLASEQSEAFSKFSIVEDESVAGSPQKRQQRE